MKTHEQILKEVSMPGMADSILLTKYQALEAMRIAAEQSFKAGLHQTVKTVKRIEYKRTYRTFDDYLKEV